MPLVPLLLSPTADPLVPLLSANAWGTCHGCSRTGAGVADGRPAGPTGAAVASHRQSMVRSSSGSGRSTSVAAGQCIGSPGPATFAKARRPNLSLAIAGAGAGAGAGAWAGTGARARSAMGVLHGSFTMGVIHGSFAGSKLPLWTLSPEAGAGAGAWVGTGGGSSLGSGRPLRTSASRRRAASIALCTCRCNFCAAAAVNNGFASRRWPSTE